MLMMFISSNALEYVLGMFNRRKLVMIISDHGEEISEAILVTERFGATMLRGKGAYSGSDREILLTVTNNVSLKRLENLSTPLIPTRSSLWKTPFTFPAASSPAGAADRGPPCPPPSWPSGPEPLCP